MLKETKFVWMNEWKPPMKIKVQVAIESDDATGETVEEVMQLERGSLRPEELGFTLAEARSLLRGV
jgi:hypothetical protein